LSGSGQFVVQGQANLSGGSLTLDAGLILGGTTQAQGVTIGGSGMLVNAGTFTALGSNTIASGFGNDATLTIQGADPASLTFANGFTNTGTITLTSIDAAGVTLTVSNGVLTNAATGIIAVDEGGGGPRTINASIDNQGTLQVDWPLALTGASESNSG